MSLVSEVLYKQIDPSTCSAKKAGELYYHLNLIGEHKMFHDDYEKYEYEQMQIRNDAVAEAIREHGAYITPNLSSTIFGISSMHQKAIIIIEV